MPPALDARDLHPIRPPSARHWSEVSRCRSDTKSDSGFVWPFTAQS